MYEPQLRIYTGPMFGSKTTKMLAFLERCSYQSRKVVAFKPKIDERYSEGEICTHFGMKFPATNVNSGADILKESVGFDVVGIDEAFMIDECSDAVLSLLKQGKTIAVSSIQISANGNPFDEIKNMLPWATHIEVCPAVCPITGKDAYYTVGKVSSLSEIEVGGADIYEPRAWTHTPFMNHKYGSNL